MNALSQLLTRQKRYADDLALWEKAYAESPDNESVRLSLANTYVENKQIEKAMPLFEKTLATTTNPLNFNDAAYTLADENVHLDKALEWGKKALATLEAESLKTKSETDALTNAQNLIATWDTVGWIYYRRGDLDHAETYLRSAFDLSQWSTVGEHLGEVFEKQGKKQQAARTYKLAYAGFGASPDLKEEIMNRLTAVTGEHAGLAMLGPIDNADGTITPSPGEQLSRMRTHHISRAARQSGSATFSLVFSPVKIENVEFVSGDEKLKPTADVLLKSDLRASLPNANPQHSPAEGSGPWRLRL